MTRKLSEDHMTAILLVCGDPPRKSYAFWQWCSEVCDWLDSDPDTKALVEQVGHDYMLADIVKWFKVGQVPCYVSHMTEDESVRVARAVAWHREHRGQYGGRT